MTIKYLELNPREEYIYHNAEYFTAWSRQHKFEFSNLKELQDFILKNNLTRKFLIYAVYQNTDANIGTIN